MPNLTITETEIKEYLNGSLQTSETIRMGTQYSGSGSSYWYHDVVVVLDLPRTLKSLTVEQTWRGHEAGTNQYVFSAALIQEQRTTAPAQADLTYTFTGNSAVITFEKRLTNGRWYLWLWRHNINSPSFVYGTRGSYPMLDMIGTPAGAGRIFRSGAWRELSPMVYKNGSWHPVAIKNMKNGWKDVK